MLDFIRLLQAFGLGAYCAGGGDFLGAGSACVCLFLLLGLELLILCRLLHL